jgi:imidazolonepropionase-like amidohydrolase
MTKVKMPKPFVQYEGAKPMYTKAQLKAYGDKCAKKALEIAAETCDSTMYIDGDGTVSKHGPTTSANVEIKKCADAIRALKEQIK